MRDKKMPSNEMKLYTCQERSGRLRAFDSKRCIAEEFIWSTSEQARLRALSVYMIRSIVEKYSGTIKIDPVGDTISVNVPKEARSACAQEIKGQLGGVWV
jgi:hypothetical protein